MAQNIFGKLLPENLKFWAKSQGAVGIDIGSSSIKVVQLRKEKERAILQTYGELATGPYVKRPIGQIVHLTDETVVEMLKDIVKEANVTAKDAAASLTVKDSFIMVIRLPLVPGMNMDETVTFEARKYIPVPISEVEINWQIINKSREENESRVAKKVETADILLVAIHRGLIQKYRGILKTAGLKMESAEIEVFSAWRSVMYRSVAPAMIIDLGASSTKASIVDSGALVSNYTIDKGAQMITTTISKSLNISFERAEELKREIGLSQAPEHKELVKVMESTLNFVFTEIRQFMIAYRRKHDKSVSQVILTGGGALLKGIVDMSIKSLGIETVQADPFTRTEYPVFLQQTMKEIGPTFSTAVGLALKVLK